METQNPNNKIDFYIISDSIGETASKLAKAAIAQFPTVTTVLHKFMFISNKESADEILKEATKRNGILLLTLVNNELAEYIENYCEQHKLTYFNIMKPVLNEITKRTSKGPSKIVGAQHDLSEEYFERVSAMEFCMRYDDGKDPNGLIEADIVLLGISRTSKTPLSMYLGNMGYKVANLPLIPENTIPKVLYEIDPKKIVGLTTSDTVVNLHRENRMKEYGLSSGTKYASMERVNEELKFSSELYQKLGCLVVNTAERSIEESASIIVQSLGLTNKAW